MSTPDGREPLGRHRWAIAEGWIPSGSTGPKPAFESHETACILNTSTEDAHVEITVFFSDRDPAGPYRVTVPPRRTLHLRFNSLEDPEPVPRDTDYSTVLESDVPVVVQHTRLDSRQAENALLSTLPAPDARPAPRRDPRPARPSSASSRAAWPRSRTSS